MDNNSAAERLAGLLQTQDLVRRIVARMLHVQADAVDEAVAEGLAALGEHLSVDRAYVFLFQGETMRNTHEWCAEGIPAEIENLQTVPVEAFAFWMDRLHAGDSVSVGNVDTLPDHRRAEREILKAQAIRSLVVVPMFSLGALVGFVGFDAVRALREFHEGEINLLRAVADGITAVLVSSQAEAEARRAQERLAALTRHASDFVLLFNEAGVPEYVSSSLQRFDLQRLQGQRSWLSRLHPNDVRAVRARIDRLLAGRAGSVVPLPDCRLLSDEQEWRWVAGTLSDLRQDDAVGALLLNAYDITLRKDFESRLANDALHDPLTGLGNRVLLADRLGHACDRIRVSGGALAVLFMDIDGFKLVNDGLGHRAGDELLARTADRLRQFAGPSDTVARFGGDEFVLLSESVTSRDDADRLSRRLLAWIKEPMTLDEQPFQLTASIGWTFVDSHDATLDPERLLADADTAMYQAKREGRNRVTRFDAQHRAYAIRATNVQQHLARALQSDELDVHYQPVVDMASRRVLGVEALVRWPESDVGPVAPSEFVPIAEESGLIGEMTEYVLARCLRDLTVLPPHIYVALNMSGYSLPRPETADWLIEQMRRAGVPPERLCIEVTETAVMRHPAAAAQTLSVLRNFGVRTALDDFGTGASSLAVLRELPVDLIKIDRSFVRGVASEPRDLSLIKAVIGLAEDFDMDVLAEGVEEEVQRRLLLEQGCRKGQGFLFSKAVPPDMIAQLVGR
ncbi:MAG: EAL domain-containing protein [Abyssibacter sp.]|uniref:putative bifunctional diguanylate cyclase/phosphodiesterase n=1 Tax=Abyssibacter sp. TaxID=2320200 RepID=UPI00321AFE99